MDIRHCRYTYNFNCVDNGKFPNHKSIVGESCIEFAVGVNVFRSLFKLSSRALAALSWDCVNGMGFANWIDAGERFREGSDSV